MPPKRKKAKPPQQNIKPASAPSQPVAAIGPPIFVSALARYTPEEWGPNTSQVDILAALEVLAANRGDNGEGTKPMEFLMVAEGGDPAQPIEKTTYPSGGRYQHTFLVRRLTGRGETVDERRDFYARHVVDGTPGPLAGPRTLHFRFPRAATTGQPTPPAPGGGTAAPSPPAPAGAPIAHPEGMPSVQAPAPLNPRASMAELRASVPAFQPLPVDEFAASRGQYAGGREARMALVQEVKNRISDWAAQHGFRAQFQGETYRVMDEAVFINVVQAERSEGSPQ